MPSQFHSSLFTMLKVVQRSSREWSISNSIHLIRDQLEQVTEVYRGSELEYKTALKVNCISNGVFFSTLR